MYVLADYAVWSHLSYSSMCCLLDVPVPQQTKPLEVSVLQQPVLLLDMSILSECAAWTCTVPEFIDPVFVKTSSKRSFSVIENKRIGLAFTKTSARIYRPSFRENEPKTLVFSHTKRAFSACFRENWVYNFGHGSIISGTDLFSVKPLPVLFLVMPVLRSLCCTCMCLSTRAFVMDLVVPGYRVCAAHVRVPLCLTCARIYRPSFRENSPKRSFSDSST